jgi:hypothetical protein
MPSCEDYDAAIEIIAVAKIKFMALGIDRRFYEKELDAVLDVLNTRRFEQGLQPRLMANAHEQIGTVVMDRRGPPPIDINLAQKLKAKV